MYEDVRRFAFAVALVLLMAPAVAGQEGQVLTNGDVLAFAEAGVPAEEIVSLIEAAQADFDTAVGALVPLSRAGVGPAVLEAMNYAAASAGTSKRRYGVFSDPLRSGGSGPEMVVIPAGRFRMGCVSGVACHPWEEPVHQVTILRAFAVGRYEVTFGEWGACASAGGCGRRPDDEGWGRGRRPVMKVSWDDAQDYVRWLSEQTGAEYRLLTESEWEYAARAGTGTAYSWGNEIGSGRANCDGCGSQWDKTQTAPVGSFGGNGLGLYDMHGNVWEWVEDCWNESYNGSPSNGGAWQSGDCSRRVLRGGSWYSDPGSLRSALRFRSTTGYRGSSVGFRVARTLTP